MTRARKKRARRLRRVLPVWLVLLSLAVGLLATVASVPIASWYFVHRIHNGWTPTFASRVRIDHELYYEYVSLLNSFGHEYWWTTAFEYPAHNGIVDYRTIEPAEARLPAFARVPYPGYAHTTDYYCSGWPLLAAEGREVSGSPSGTVAGRTRRADWLMTVSTQGLPIQIPLRPIWPGVLGNLLFYTMPALVLLASMRLGLLALRRRRRRRRGKCIGCGYEPGNGITTCPECGRAMPSALDETS